MPRRHPMFTVLAVALAALPAQEAPVPLWGRFETSFTARDGTGPDTDLVVELTSPSGRERTAARAGTGLEKKAGTFVCRADPKGGRWQRHGPIVVSSNGRHLQHVDGTPFFWLGDTVWTGPAFSSKPDWLT